MIIMFVTEYQLGTYKIWLGRGTKCHTLFLVKLLSSSCIAITQAAPHTRSLVFRVFRVIYRVRNCDAECSKQQFIFLPFVYLVVEYHT